VSHWPGRAPTEARPGGRRARHRKPGVAAAGCFLEQSAEGRLPAGAEGRDPERPEQLLARVPREVQQGIRLSDPHLFGAGAKLDDLVSGLYLALCEHAKVEARAMM